MTPGPVDEYLRELERLLRERGCTDARIVDEAREHLGDAAHDGVCRGLTREDAEREAIERFGPAALIAAQALPGRSRLMARLSDTVDLLTGHWRRIAAATAAAALLTSAASRFLPTRYRSEMVIGISRVPAQGGDDHQSVDRLQIISNTILSRPRLEMIAKDVGLDKGQADGPIADVVEQMRRNISIEIGQPSRFTVGFQSSDPRLAMRVTERIASLFIQENLQQDGTARAGGQFLASQMLDSEIEDVRFRLAQLEAKLEAARAQHLRIWRTDMVPFEVLQDRYRRLLEKREEDRLASRMLGEQYRVLKGARVPDRPVGPSRAAVTTTGAFAGLTLAIAATLVRRRDPHAV